MRLKHGTIDLLACRELLDSRIEKCLYLRKLDGADASSPPRDAKRHRDCEEIYGPAFLRLSFPLFIELRLLLAERNHGRAIILAGEMAKSVSLSIHDKWEAYCHLFEGLLIHDRLLYNANTPINESLDMCFVPLANPVAMDVFATLFHRLVTAVEKHERVANDVKKYMTMACRQTLLRLFLNRHASVSEIPVDHAQIIRFPELASEKLEEWAKDFLNECNTFPESWEASDGDYPGENILRLLELVDGSVSPGSATVPNISKPGGNVFALSHLSRSTVDVGTVSRVRKDFVANAQDNRHEDEEHSQVCEVMGYTETYNFGQADANDEDGRYKDQGGLDEEAQRADFLHDGESALDSNEKHENYNYYDGYGRDEEVQESDHLNEDASVNDDMQQRRNAESLGCADEPINLDQEEDALDYNSDVKVIASDVEGAEANLADDHEVEVIDDSSIEDTSRVSGVQSQPKICAQSDGFENTSDSETSEEQSSEASIADGYNHEDRSAIPDTTPTLAAFLPQNKSPWRESSSGDADTSENESMKGSPERSTKVESTKRQDQLRGDVTFRPNGREDGSQRVDGDEGSIASDAEDRPVVETEMYENDSGDDDSIDGEDGQQLVATRFHDAETDHEMQAIVFNDNSKTTESQSLVEAGYEAEDSLDAATDEDDDRPNVPGENRLEDTSGHASHTTDALNIPLQAPIKASLQVDDVGYEPEDSQGQSDFDRVPEPTKAPSKVDDVGYEPEDSQGQTDVDGVRRKRGFETGYEAEDSQGHTEEDEDMHTEDDEERNPRIGHYHLGAESSSEIEGAEISVDCHIGSPLRHNYSGEGTLAPFAASVQREYDTHRAGFRMLAPGSRAQVIFTNERSEEISSQMASTELIGTTPESFEPEAADTVRNIESFACFHSKRTDPVTDTARSHEDMTIETEPSALCGGTNSEKDATVHELLQDHDLLQTQTSRFVDGASDDMILIVVNPIGNESAGKDKESDENSVEKAFPTSEPYEDIDSMLRAPDVDATIAPVNPDALLRRLSDNVGESTDANDSRMSAGTNEQLDGTETLKLTPSHRKATSPSPKMADSVATRLMDQISESAFYSPVSSVGMLSARWVGSTGKQGRSLHGNLSSTRKNEFSAEDENDLDVLAKMELKPETLSCATLEYTDGESRGISRTDRASKQRASRDRGLLPIREAKFDESLAADDELDETATKEPPPRSRPVKKKDVLVPIKKLSRKSTGVMVDNVNAFKAGSAYSSRKSSRRVLRKDDKSALAPGGSMSTRSNARKVRDGNFSKSSSAPGGTMSMRSSARKSRDVISSKGASARGGSMSTRSSTRESRDGNSSLSASRMLSGVLSRSVNRDKVKKTLVASRSSTRRFKHPPANKGGDDCSSESETAESRPAAKKASNKIESFEDIVEHDSELPKKGFRRQKAGTKNKQSDGDERGKSAATSKQQPRSRLADASKDDNTENSTVAGRSTRSRKATAIQSQPAVAAAEGSQKLTSPTIRKQAATSDADNKDDDLEDMLTSSPQASYVRQPSDSNKDKRESERKPSTSGRNPAANAYVDDMDEPQKPTIRGRKRIAVVKEDRDSQKPATRSHAHSDDATNDDEVKQAIAPYSRRKRTATDMADSAGLSQTSDVEQIYNTRSVTVEATAQTRPHHRSHTSQSAGGTSENSRTTRTQVLGKLPTSLESKSTSSGGKPPKKAPKNDDDSAATGLRRSARTKK